MARVLDLLPGEIVHQGEEYATFIAAMKHPVYQGLRLVIWKLQDGTWSLDALSIYQVVGTVEPSSIVDRWDRIQRAFGV
jgi:hypothetical protein